MKKLITIIFCLIAFSTHIFAQTPYLPTEQLEAARTEAAKVLTEPQLISIATINGTIPGLEVMGTPIPIAFDMTDGASKGKATGWVYFFNSASEPQNIQAIAIGVTPFGVLPFNLTTLGSDLGALAEFASPNSLDAKQWMNSNAMIPYLTASSAYTGFISTYPNSKPKYIVLGYADYVKLDPDTPYWFVTMYDPSDSLLIAVNALTGDVITNINENLSEVLNIAVYPNPAQDFAIVQLKSENPAEIFTVSIFNITGKKVIEDKSINGEFNKVDLRKLNNGKYFLHVNSGKENKVFPIVISR